MERLDFIASKIIDAVEGYEFESFLIGASLPTGIYEREDSLRARLKIRGKESVKNQLTRELGIRLARMAKKKVEYMKPDVTINLTIDRKNNVDVMIKSRTLALYGRYIKKSRGIPQRQDRCKNCEGVGCNYCRNTGLSGYESVEGIIAKGLVEITGGQSPKFTWIGSEDQNSLVLGTGRPFYARILNPRIRSLGGNKIRAKGLMATLSVIDDEKPELQPRFKVKTRIQARSEGELSRENLRKLKSLAGLEVRFENRARMTTKRIYSAKARRLEGNEFILTIIADGGLMIKQFVGGEEYMSPNISDCLQTKCECIAFDILDVSLQ